MAGSSPVSHWCHHVRSLSQGDFPCLMFRPNNLFKVDDYLGEHPDVTTLTAMFFFLNFLAATQDIAVDGWALTMLQVHGKLLHVLSFDHFSPSETQRRLCINLQLCGTDSWIFHGIRLLYGPGVLWSCDPPLLPPILGGHLYHHHHLRGNLEVRGRSRRS